ncbi:MAG TPA: TIR domain-containing protein, partial [Longimicrobium sp.]
MIPGACLVLAATAGCSRGGDVEPARGEVAAFPYWQQSNLASAAGFDLRDAWFRHDGSEGWSVGSRGVILHLSGNDWHLDTLSTDTLTIDFKGIAMRADGRMGFAVGNGGWVARYSGHQWTAARVVEGVDSLGGVWLDSAGAEGYAVGTPGVVLRWSEQRWAPLPLPGIPPEGVLVEVGANRGEVWIQEQPRLHVFDRRAFTRSREIPDFQASKLWIQTPSETVWAAGVPVGPRGFPLTWQGYSVRRYVYGDIGSITRIPWLPSAGWFGAGGACGIVAVDSGPHHKLAFTRDEKVWAWPIAAKVNAVWTDGGCRTGWVVGDDGFVARLDTRDLVVSRFRQELGASLQQLTGTHTLVMGPGVAAPRVDSLQLLYRPGALALYPVSHFTVDRTRDHQVRLRFTPEGRGRAEQLAGNPVRLRFHLRHPVADSGYAVAYDQSAQFVLMPAGWWRNALRYVALALLVLLAGFLVLIKHSRARGDGAPEPLLESRASQPGEATDVADPAPAGRRTRRPGDASPQDYPPQAGAARGPTVFLCHASEDKPHVIELYADLKAQGIEPWLDKQNLVGGQHWMREIRRVIRGATAVVICLSNTAVRKRGVFQREIKLALSEAEEQPEGTIFIIPVLLEACTVPDALKHLHVVDLTEECGVERLAEAIRHAYGGTAMT